MRKRNKESEDKKWWIMEGWKALHRSPVIKKEPVLSSGILLRDTTYNTTELLDHKYGWPGGWDQQMKDMSAAKDGRLVPVEIWKQYKPYVKTIDSIRKSWPLYTIEDGKFKDHEWPKKANTKRIRKATNKQ